MLKGVERAVMIKEIIEDVEALKSFFKSKLIYEVYGLVFVLIIIILLNISFYNVVKTIHCEVLAVSLVGLVGLTVAWVWYREYYPGNSESKIGVVFSMETESKKQRIRCNDDLVYKIEKHILELGLSHLFNIIILDDYKSKKLNGVLKLYSSVSVPTPVFCTTAKVSHIT